MNIHMATLMATLMDTRTVLIPSTLDLYNMVMGGTGGVGMADMVGGMADMVGGMADMEVGMVVDMVGDMEDMEEVTVNDYMNLCKWFTG
jgi:hypothetical protein